MFGPTKRRHVSYYLSLPCVVAIVFLLVAKLAALQRAEVVAQLADRVSHRDAAEATAALRQLAAMGRPPLDVLVVAATSADPDVADESQHVISRLLRRWQQKIAAGQSLAGVARQLGELSAALAQHHQAFSRADDRWLGRTAKKVLALANALPPRHSPSVALQCDTVLAAVARRQAQIAQSPKRELLPAGKQVILGEVVPPSQGRPLNPGQPVLQREFTTVATQPTATSAHGADPNNDPGTAIEPGTVIEMTRASQQTQFSGAEHATHPARGLEWTYPLINVSPATPINALNVRMAQPVDEPQTSLSAHQPDEPVAPTRPLAGADSRALLRRWLDCDDSELYALEEELTDRGFGRLSARLVDQLFSDNADDRLRLVDDVLTEPGIDPRHWLVLLADDASADVRLLAVTIMATSDDRMLLDKAWEVAINDHDPRIASLASRLRDRRDRAGRH